eukprot:maker-scaffold5_size1054832-snap-gene-1.14 protein:Tk04023 transcript:maker-scaffold5_size1054832-snap-gene-1.14-mRNA-1 annotation:"leucine-rich repeat-containing protein 8d-like"
MTSLGDVLVNKILGHSEAERAFRPWWDNLEDYLIYGLVMLGILVAPTAIIISTPIDCTFCSKPGCNPTTPMNLTSPQVDPGFNNWWVKKYCTFMAMDEFILYFPYILLIMALVIVFMERIFIELFKSGMKLSLFYNLLVKETLATSTVPLGKEIYDNIELENSKTILQISQSFSQGSMYFVSNVLRTISEFLMALALLLWLLYYGLPNAQKGPILYCDVHGYLYECAGHPQQFYLYVVLIVLVIIVAYLLCCLYNILWLSIPQMGALSGLMYKYKKRLKRKARIDKAESIPDKGSIFDRHALGELHNIYYNNRDLKLLLDLLAQTSGVAPAIRILALFDKGFKENTLPSDFRVIRDGDKAEIIFRDPPTVKELFSGSSDVTVTYTVELLPSTPTSSVFVFTVGSDRESYTINAVGDTEQPITNNEGKTRRAFFTDLDPTEEYTIRACTVIGGRAIARRIEKVQPLTKDDDTVVENL